VGQYSFIKNTRIGPFSEGLNVLHAPTGTGKSSVFEALLRGFFDGHRVAGKEAEAIRPWGRSLAPTVSIEFVNEEKEYRLTKRFLDQPSALLERREKDHFIPLSEGDAADQQIREILRGSAPGRGLTRSDNWGLAQILWVPQAELTLPKFSGDILFDIRSSLGVQVSGPGGDTLEQRIADAYIQIFTSTGKLKTGKDAPSVVSLQNQL